MWEQYNGGMRKLIKKNLLRKNINKAERMGEKRKDNAVYFIICTILFYNIYLDVQPRA